MQQQSGNHGNGRGAMIDAFGLSHRELAIRLRHVLSAGNERVNIRNVCGQRYIGTGMQESARIDIYGIPGNDLGCFMQGPRIHVHGNAQDGCGNTLDGGELIIHGHAGDIAGYSMRGGKMFIRDDVGYRAAIHMKACLDKKPAIVIGGGSQPFLGEYMAGGVVVVLGLNGSSKASPCTAGFIGTGMHGGTIYIRGRVEEWQLGPEVAAVEARDLEAEGVANLVREFCAYFDYDAETILKASFVKISPRHLRPYGKLYAY